VTRKLKPRLAPDTSPAKCYNDGPRPMAPAPAVTDLDPAALPLLRTPVPGPASRAWLLRLRAVESANVTAIDEAFPVVWSAARGGAVRDADGNVYVDATGAFGVALLGHGHPEVVAAVQRQAAALLHAMGDVHPAQAKVELLESLQRAAPAGLGSTVLCTGGSEAVEVALKTALLATGKPGVIAFSGAYHGLGHGALDATSRREFRDPFWPQLARNVAWVPFPRADRPPLGVAAHDVAAHVLSRVDELLSDPSAGGVPIGAVLVEPVQGRAGAVVPPEGFLRDLRTLCSDRGVLLIADEIFTGLGRTGALWACDREGVAPDLLCIGKALGGGMPLSACLGRPEVMAAWGPSRGEALHTSTFLGHPVACAAATAALAVVARDGVPAQADVAGRLWLDELRGALGSHRAVRAIRGTGLMMGVELRDCSGQSARTWAWRVVTGALRRGVVVLPAGATGEVVQLTPPVVLTAAQRTVVVAAIAAALDD